MQREHFAALLCMAVWMAGLLFFVLRIRQGSRLYRMSQRVFWAFLGVWLCRAWGLFGLNAVTLSVSALFGLPGFAALFVLGQM